MKKETIVSYLNKGYLLKVTTLTTPAEYSLVYEQRDIKIGGRSASKMLKNLTVAKRQPGFVFYQLNVT